MGQVERRKACVVDCRIRRRLVDEHARPSCVQGDFSCGRCSLPDLSGPTGLVRRASEEPVELWSVPSLSLRLPRVESATFLSCPSSCLTLSLSSSFALACLHASYRVHGWLYDLDTGLVQDLVRHSFTAESVSRLSPRVILTDSAVYLAGCFGRAERVIVQRRFL